MSWPPKLREELQEEVVDKVSLSTTCLSSASKPVVRQIDVCDVLAVLEQPTKSNETWCRYQVASHLQLLQLLEVSQVHTKTGQGGVIESVVGETERGDLALEESC